MARTPRRANDAARVDAAVARHERRPSGVDACARRLIPAQPRPSALRRRSPRSDHTRSMYVSGLPSCPSQASRPRPCRRRIRPCRRSCVLRSMLTSSRSLRVGACRSRVSSVRKCASCPPTRSPRSRALSRRAYRALVIFDAYCGLRLSELAGLRRGTSTSNMAPCAWQRTPLRCAGEIVWGAPKTRAGRRTVPVPSAVVAQLSTHLDTYVADDPHALVFGGDKGGVLRAGSGAAASGRSHQASGCRGRAHHDMRHTAVALWIAAGANAKQIATWAGHTSVSVVLDRYGHLFAGHETEVLSRLDAFVESAAVPPSDGESRGVPRGFRGGKAKTRDHRRREKCL